MNDEVIGVPVAITYCPLCNSAVGFVRRAAGRTLTFGVSGELESANLVMFDRQTISVWNQLTGQAFTGPLAGKHLRLIPAQILPFGTWRSAHPGGSVLEPKGVDRATLRQDPYYWYDNGPGQQSIFIQPPGLAYVPQTPTRSPLPPKWLVIGALVQGRAVGFPWPRGHVPWAVEQAQAGDTSLVAFFRYGTSQTGRAYYLSGAPRGWSGEVFESNARRRRLSFRATGAGVVETTTGSRFSLFGLGLSGPLRGVRLKPVSQATAYWFAWSHFYPRTRIAG